MTAAPPLVLRFADWSAGLDLTDVPDPVRHAARRAVVDTLAVMAAGAVHPKVSALASGIATAPGPCTAITGQRTTAEAAATLNGMAAHLWDFDDNSYTGMIHGSAIVLPAVLAAAESSGADDDTALLGFIAGSEVAYVLGEICGHSHFLAGWWATGSCALVGAVAGVARVRGLDAARTGQALGMAAVSAGVNRAIAGTDTKPFLCGHVAARALALVEAATLGLTGPLDGFEQENGFFTLLNGGQSQPAAADDLGRRWRLVEPGLLVKTSPVCSAAHAVIEVTAALLAEAGKRAHDIDSALAEVPRMVRASLVFDAPETPQQAQFSLPYALACAALSGRVRLADLDPGAILSPDRTGLMARVRVTVADDLSRPPSSADFPESTRLTLRFADGTSVTGFCGEAFGMPNRPLGDEDLRAKFADCLSYAGKVVDLPDIAEAKPCALLRRIAMPGPSEDIADRC